MVVMGFKPILKGEAKQAIEFLEEQYREAKSHKDKEGMAYWEGAIRGVKDMLKRSLSVVGNDIPSYYKRH